MVNVQEAADIIGKNLYKPIVQPVSLTEATGKVLAENVVADRDFPPFNRVSMDGLALQYDIWKNGQREFQMEDIQAAGEPQKKLKDPRHGIEIMTGAILPEGTDTVIRYEDLNISGGVASVITDEIQLGMNVHRQGQDATKNELLLEPGIILSPAEIALLASVGKAIVKTYSFPRTAIVASGDELVEINQIPLAHQIRRSNTYAIESAMKILGWKGTPFHMPDVREILQRSLKQITTDHDVIILSGGVSKGKFDYIPEVLEEIGIQKLFHQVSQRPGKPFWFGVSAQGKVVFALPGNPVSTYMCFYRYIRPWLLQSLGVIPKPSYAILAREITFQPKLTYFLQVRVANESGQLVAYPDAGGGSGDFANLKKVDGFLELPMEKTDFKAGEAFPYIPFRL
ncbi:MAG: molybdopterin molybdotransferase MoeA [Bacteroidota bacterium]